MSVGFPGAIWITVNVIIVMPNKSGIMLINLRKIYLIMIYDLANIFLLIFRDMPLYKIITNPAYTLFDPLEAPIDYGQRVGHV